ncbi:MAG: SOS response-associated peptidase [Verrucomicrobiae bacterium]|nr:SOS response-associated peptidase [Verrucomicrobiae bacterium]
MCSRFSQCENLKTIHKQCNVYECHIDEKPRYNIAPSHHAQIVLNDGAIKSLMLRWGLVPSWAVDEKIANHLINARAESLNEKPAFKNLLKKQRCLIPADGFYEWQKTGRYKQPLRFLMKDDSPFAFAGLWDKWTSPDGSTLYTFTIITTPPNNLIKPIHNRMPAIMPPEDYLKWLDPEISSIHLLKSILKPFPTEKMRYYKVSPMVNNPNYNSPDCIKPSNPPEQTELHLPNFN